ncbi:AEC family transporter [Caldanaerobius polysaccharolyticus]|uniref:AEC family transporter n=1 Tax=Caldanaerobius polysaccharolyticus TaxID=44256 RepID=UPI00047AF699|nr:AEC family transporter [Caldanaerobius polysaccharolyticus]
MNQLAIAEKIFSNLSVIFLGYLIKRLKLLPEGAGDVLSKFILYVTLPATIINVFLNSKLYAQFFILPLISIFLGIFTFVLGYILVRKVHLDSKTKWTLIISICGYNVGLFAFPFIQQVYGNKGLITMAMFDMGNSFIVFGLAYGISFLASEGEKINFSAIIKKVLCFFPLDIYVLSIFINITGIQFPELLKEMISQLAVPNGVLALFTIGYFLDFKLSRDELKALAIGVFVKFLPGLLLLLFVILAFSTKSLLVKILTIGALLPTPMVAVIYSIDRGLNVKLSSVLVTVTIMFSIIFMMAIMLLWR